MAKNGTDGGVAESTVSRPVRLGWTLGMASSLMNQLRYSSDGYLGDDDDDEARHS